MPMQEAHPKRVRNAFIRATLDDGMSVRAAHELALAGGMRGVEPHEVPPLKTCASWRSDEARIRETEKLAGTEKGSDEIVDEVLSMVTLALRADAQRLAKKRPRATPEDWARLAKAAGEVAKARKMAAANAPKATRTPAASDAPAEQHEPGQDTETSWLDQVAADA